MAHFNKKNLTLQIEEIEKETAEMEQSKKPDSQEDSPIREGIV